ncbi:transposase, IS4 family [Nitrosococcus oceani ATCC 19707]|uniref:Transposase, IS4 family n=1 Tax=Nitrosococcus oceani (strain ATCC 19707 / BCRC 17464 / JCM 30415 / NCIMB 11848 / C-107) TaxID=323261 RepID=Q3JDA5_NITOC|nr:IS5-like element ISNoc2 family transposase [Nitrosococcus oceani]ABA57191.1 transposase, IS4 family [Nitrosococcus oceani ATCC 19707]GEM21507.1 IS5 family transposase ISNoc2 [Nitrosococcus oceani]
MKPQTPPDLPTDDLFRHRLENLIDTRHELAKLAALIDWEFFDAQWGEAFCENGRPAIATRLIAGLHYLKHTYGLSDEQVVQRWAENPYWQYFCGERYFQHELPLNPSSLTRWRQRLGDEGMESLLSATIDAAIASKAVKARDLKCVTVDTTVQEKAIAFPTDSKLYNRARERLVRLAKAHGVPLRQSYVRVGPRLLFKNNRYGYARQTRRMRRTAAKLKTVLGRVVRDIERKLPKQSASVQAAFAESMALTKRLLDQQRHDKNKLYALHAPEVECIAKGTAHKRYEFGVKVSIATTNRSNLVVGAQSLPGSPYDGHTLKKALHQVERLTGQRPERCYVDLGYRGHDVDDVDVFKARQKRGVTRTIRRELKRRNAIEPIIGHMKNDGLLHRNYLKGVEGDAINAILCGAGQNLRLILRYLRIFWLKIQPAFIQYLLLAPPRAA